LITGLFSFLLILAGCSKDDDAPPTNKTKTELLTQASWKFEKAEAATFGDVSNQIDDCIKDNIITFTATANATGTGIADEGTTKCGATQQTTFNWTLDNNETKLTSDKPLFTGGSGEFTIVTLTETNLVVSQQMTIPGIPAPINVTLTLKH
jgi:hypothetical protein